MSMRLQWLSDYSDIGNEIQSNDALKIVKESSKHLIYSGQHNFSDYDVDSINGSLSLKKKQTCMVKMLDLSNYHELLEDFSKREFNIFSFSK